MECARAAVSGKGGFVRGTGFARTVVLESRRLVATAPGTDKSRITRAVVSTPIASEAAPIASAHFICKGRGTS